MLERYVEAHDRADTGAVAELLREDAWFTMPPQPALYLGRETITAFFRR